MANFPTHIAVGTIVSGALATVTMAADLVAPENIVAVTLAGVLGSVLPDIDLKDSKFERAEAPGVALVVDGIVLGTDDDERRVAEGTHLFDALYARLRTSPRAPRRA